MFFRWWQRRRRQRCLEHAFPSHWIDVLERNVFLYGRLTHEEKKRVRDYVQVFVQEKHWEGCGGMVITDEVRVTIAAQVGILVLGFPEEYFERVLSILVYPDTYVAPERTLLGGLVVEGSYPTEGEAWYRGPIILSWAEVLAGARNEGDGSNLVIHEFAHQLDMLNGNHADGIPPLSSAEYGRRWVAVLQREHQRLVQDCRHGRLTVFDCYGTNDHAEFFAVVSEAFFQQSGAMRQRHAELYELLCSYFGQDPASR